MLISCFICGKAIPSADPPPSPNPLTRTITVKCQKCAHSYQVTITDVTAGTPTTLPGTPR